MTPRQEILARFGCALLTHSGLHVDVKKFIEQLRPYVNEVLDQDESPMEVAKRVPHATPQTPFEGLAWMGEKWIPVWFDGSVWKRNNATGTDVTSAMTYWRSLQAP